MKSPRHTARGIVIHDGKVLLIERWRGSLHYFSIPGGGIESGETPEQTVLREIQEETSCIVTVQRPLYLLTSQTGSKHHIFLCDYKRGEPHLPSGSPEYINATPKNRFVPLWFDISELPGAPFLVWKPIVDQLLSDLTDGFKPGVVSLSP